MPSILLKDVSSALHRRLKEQAERNRRSMAQEAITILEGTLQNIPPIKLPKPIAPLKPISTAMILKAIRAGRK
jgi:hypothetical protein